MAWWESVLHGLLFFLPAYVANMSPVFAARLVPRWNAPIDGGRVAKDGKRLLGPGKTWRGLAGGAVAGALTAGVVSLVVPGFDGMGVAEPFEGEGVFHGWDYGLKGFAGAPIGSDGTCDDTASCEVPSSHIAGVLLFGALLGTAALVGDAAKSYFKRRRGKDRGAPWVPFDQLDFVAAGLLAAFLASPLLADGWVRAALLDDWIVLGTIVLLTPGLHFLVNVVGYWLKLKEVPW